MSYRLSHRLVMRALLDEFARGFENYTMGLGRFEPLAKLGDPSYIMPESLRYPGGKPGASGGGK